MDMRFTDRSDAGRRLAEQVSMHEFSDAVVLALPRGGVPVGYEVAIALDAPLDTIVARKIGAPGNPEYGIGAIAPGGVLILDGQAMTSLGLRMPDIDPIIQRESAEMERRMDRYRSGAYASVARAVILADDGLATGVTARAAIESVKRSRNPERIVFAAPVCARDGAELIRAEVDELVCLMEPEDFGAVGSWYEEFPQTSDEEVESLLELAAARSATS